MTADEIWQDMLAGTDVLKSRPNFRYDPVFCANYYPDFFAGRPWLIKTLEKTVMVGKRGGNAYQMLTSRIPNIDRAVTELVTDARLRRAIDEGVEDAHELVFELISLGEPIDREISNFSQDHYFTAYPDIARSGVAGLRHFVQSGMAEGRHSLRDVLENQHKGAVAFDPAKPTCLICTHDLTKTGAPIVGLTLAQKAAETHNVVVLALRPGELLKPFLETTVGVFVSPNLDGDLEYCSLIDIETVDFAILNSVETYPFAKALVRRDVPFATYLHEFADYTQPPSKMIFLALFSDLLVFSSQIVRQSWSDIFRSMAFDEVEDSMILPQAELQIGSVSSDDHTAARARLSQLLGVDCSTRRIVYGAGYAHWRKGTDLFVLTAQMARQQDPETLFIWVGDGQDHEDIHFGVWLDKHLREARANTREGNLFFLPAGEHYADICKAADAFYLCSRLDPLPNVIFDAVKHGGRAVIYEKASGFDDPAYLAHDEIQTVPYGDIAAATTSLLSVPLKQVNRDSASGEPARSDIFQSIATALQAKLTNRPDPITQTGDYDVAVMFSPDVADREARIKERQKLWSYGRSFVWKSLEEAQTTLAASDNWIHRSERIERFAHLGAVGGFDYSIHMHAHYIDNLAHDFAQYKALKEARDVIVTTDNDEKAARIQDMAQLADIKARTLVVPNKGRDILPFMQLFTQGHADTRDIWCHVHQKKSVGTSHAGDVWHAFLMAILLGDKTRMSSALEHMQDNTTGLVAPFDPYWCDWAGSRRLLPHIASKLPGPLPEHLLLFPVGNMFWTRGTVVEQMNKLFDPGYPWPNEPLPSDGTVFHLIERLWPAASAMAGLTTVFLEKIDQQRT
ncbi:MAG: rhamnan synthesis F family protein [Pseudomonadota bacterium]